MGRLLALAPALVGVALLSTPALPQSGGYRDVSGVIVPLVVVGCLNDQGRAVPCPPGGGGTPQTPPTATTAVVALPQGVPVQLAGAGLRRFSIQVQGTGRVQIGVDNTVCSAGYRLDGAPSATSQATVQTWNPANASAYWGCAPDAASSVFVERGQ